MESAFYTVDQLAEYLNVPKMQAYALVKSKDFPVSVKKIGRHFRISVASLQKWANDSMAS